ncbi:putative small acid-soluble spore protein [Bacillus sp. TS-2]|nr:putative small acid-soluble spore protein [Bacillus sp. TS-2]
MLILSILKGGKNMAENQSKKQQPSKESKQQTKKNNILDKKLGGPNRPST